MQIAGRRGPARGVLRLGVPLMVLALCLPATAQQKEAAPPKPAQSWTVNCASGANGELACALSQVMVVKDSGQRVLTVSVLKEQGGIIMRLSLPHGLDLPKGVDVWIDEAPRKNNPIVTADKSGSYAVIALTDAMIAELKQGTQLNVAVTAFAGKEIVLQLSLAGFTAGFAKL